MELFKQENIILSVKGTSQKDILSAFAKQAKDLGYVRDEEECYHDLVNRELESTTGFGNGIAIPHARSTNVMQAAILFGQLEQKVEWSSIDGEPVEVCLCLLVPEGEGNLHLVMLSKLTRKLIYDDFVALLKDAQDTNSILDAINTALI